MHGGVETTVIERRQQQLGRMADFPPPVIKSEHLSVCITIESLYIPYS